MAFKEWQPPVDQAELKRMFFLHESDGYFTRKTNINRGRGNTSNDVHSLVTGTMTSSGTLKMMVNGQYYQAHHLVWLYVYGEFPELNIGHIDGDKTNNAVDNLALIPKGKRSLPTVSVDGDVDIQQLRDELELAQDEFKALGPAYRAAKKKADQARYKLTSTIERASSVKAKEVSDTVEAYKSQPEVSFL